MPKKEPHSRMKILMLEKVPHGLMNSRSFILFMIYWEVRLKPPNIALSLALHWLPGNGRDRLVFVLWACSCSARRWLDLPGPGFVAIHRPAQMPRVQAPYYITLHYTSHQNYQRQNSSRFGMAQNHRRSLNSFPRFNNWQYNYPREQNQQFNPPRYQPYHDRLLVHPYVYQNEYEIPVSNRFSPLGNY